MSRNRGCPQSGNHPKSEGGNLPHLLPSKFKPPTRGTEIRAKRGWNIDEEGGGSSQEVDGDASSLVDRLESAGLVVALDGLRLQVSGGEAGGEMLDIVRDELAATDMSLHRLQRRTTSLEDLFLEVGG